MIRRAGVRPLGVLVALLVSLGPAGVAFAGQTEGEVLVKRLSLSGVRSIDQVTLKEALGTRQGSRLPWGRKRFFDQRTFDADLQRIQAFYADRGFPDARVISSDVAFNSQKTAVEITITIDEGAPVNVAAIEFAGFEVIQPDRVAKIQDDIPLRVGRPRDRALLLASHDVALNELRNQGFPYARVLTTESPGRGPGTTTVVFASEPGALSYFGDVEISGNTSVGANVIRRELDYHPGDLYRRSLMQNTQRRLYGLALFQFVNVIAVNPDAQDPVVRTQVSVTEGKHQRVNAGVGYGSEDKVRVDGEYRHVNFLGAARSAGVHGRWSSLDRGVRADFTQPYFFQPHLSLGTEAQRWYTFTPAYESAITGARVAVTHRGGPATSISVSIATERSSSSIADSVLGDPKLVGDLIALGLDPTTGKQEGTLSSFGFDVQRSTADDLLSPRRGYQFSFHAEEAGVLLPGSFDYYALAIDGRQYQPIGNHVVVASHLQAGNIGPVGSSATNVPFSKKYFLGGATTLRGWGRYEVSPLSTSGVPLGGNSFLAYSLEGRADIKGSLGGALFLDAGNVWITSSGFALNDLRYSIGPGLRYRTPIGPIRFDLGYQLNPIPGLVKDGELKTSRFRFNFSIGEAY